MCFLAAKVYASEAVGVHSQIVGELTHRKRVWIYTEICESTITTQWKPLGNVLFSGFDRPLNQLISSKFEKCPNRETLAHLLCQCDASNDSFNFVDKAKVIFGAHKEEQARSRLIFCREILNRICDLR